MRLLLAALMICSLAVAVGCAGNPNSSLAKQCENGLSIAYKELDFAKANGFGGTVEQSKAAGLLTAAKCSSSSANTPTASRRSIGRGPLSTGREPAADPAFICHTTLAWGGLRALPDPIPK